jgi:hypothetical protein
MRWGLPEFHGTDRGGQFTTKLDEVCRLWNELRPGPSRPPLTRRSKNRLYNKLCGKWSPNDLSGEAEAIIWNWASDPDSFFRPSDHDPDISTHSMLDSVCRLLNHLQKTRTTVDPVRWRLLLCFLVEFVDEQIAGVSDPAEISLLLVQAKLVSPGLEQLLVVHLKKWLSAGRRYMSLANELGGLGALLVLPDFRPTYFEEHYHPTGGDRPGIIQRLKGQVPGAASLKRGDRDAYEVADTLRQHLRTKCPMSFLSCDPSSRRGMSRKTALIRRPRIHRASRVRTPTPRRPTVYHPPGTPSPTRRPMSEFVHLWQVPSSTGQSPWGGNVLTPDDASSTQLSFPNEDDCHQIFPGSSAPLVF